MRDKINYLVFVLFLATVFFLPGTAAAESQAETIQKLIKMVEAQQRQIDMLKKEVETLKAPAKAETPAASTAAKTPVMTTKGMAKSGNDKVQLQVYGQVNRAVLATDDGTNTDLFHVDNNNSSTRIGMKGKAKINDDLTAGTKIEVQFASNSTAAVDQDNESAGPNNFTKRHLDAYFQSKTWGKFSIGQGDTATNGTSEIDLSGTSVAGYSYAGGVAGGLNFVDPATDNLSGIQISDVMSHMDGLSRNDRFRY
ncbi:MAG: porin, partial [Desulfobacterales bacterium]|nr:porin [Desulfobacterales bacterium]